MVLLLGSSIISPVIKGSAIFNFAKFLLVSRGSVFPTWKKLPLLWLTVIFSKRRSPLLPGKKCPLLTIEIAFPRPELFRTLSRATVGRWTWWIGKNVTIVPDRIFFSFRPIRKRNFRFSASEVNETRVEGEGEKKKWKYICSTVETA